MECAGTLSWSEVGLVAPPRRSSGKQLPPETPVRPPRHAPSPLTMDAPGSGTPKTPAAGQAPGGKAGASGLRQGRVEVGSLEVDWAQVVRLCMNGDSGAWAELVRTHHRRVYGLCYRFTGNPADAEDLTQDVFLKIYSNLASFDLTRGSLQVWITTMTRNLLVDNFRRTRNQRATSSLDDGWESTEEFSPIDRLTSRGPSPHESAAQKELAK